MNSKDYELLLLIVERYGLSTVLHCLGNCVGDVKGETGRIGSKNSILEIYNEGHIKDDIKCKVLIKITLDKFT